MVKSISLDRKDRRILETLQRDGRIANVDLAKQVGLSPTPCLERVRRLEKEGFIRGYVALVDAQKLNSATIAFIQVSLTSTASADLRAFNRAMLALPEVEGCHMVAGGFDYLLKVRCADMNAYKQFLGEQLAIISLIEQTHTYVVIEEVKAKTEVSLANLPPLQRP
ncbi:MAG: winged helix-turn-helix transcriptional regulator [Pseudomonadota bacterium]